MAPRRLARSRGVATCCVVASMLCGVLVAAGPPSGAASADRPDPKAQKRRLDAQIGSTWAELQETTATLVASSRVYDALATRLKALQARYAVTQGELAVARAADQVAAQRLRRAEQALDMAKVAVADGEEMIVTAERDVGQAVRATYQQHTSLLNIAIVLQGTSPVDLATGAQVQRTVFDVQSGAMTRLRNAQAQLANRQAKVVAAERAVADERAAAAATLARVRAVDAQVAEQKAQVTQATIARHNAHVALLRERQAELARYQALVAERNRVTQILAARARAELAAAIAAERARALREHRRPRQVGGSGGPGQLFMRPIPGAPITSPYGMRYHPILHYWKLHDGTDFGAGCGTPIHAAAGGVVTDRYYNGGYGNRVFVSHGIHRGVHLVTVYNHLSAYSTYVGQRVGKGDVIGYVGSTGYSTGCHLHFMLYQDGRTVDPMSWY